MNLHIGGCLRERERKKKVKRSRVIMKQGVRLSVYTSSCKIQENADETEQLSL